MSMRNEAREMKPSELVKKAMERAEVGTAYALAKVTGISEDSLKNYEKDKVGKNGITNDFARRLAEVAGLNPLEVIAELEIEKAQDEATKSAWGKALASFRSKALVLLLAAVAAWSSATAPVQSPAWVLLLIVLTIIFIMSSWRKLKRLLRQMLRKAQKPAFPLRVCKV